MVLYRAVGVATVRLFSGSGYIDDDGQLRAGVDLWNLRDFMRRSAVLQHAMGREHTVLWPHMTTFNVLPIIGWATINYDWEWHMAGDGADEMNCKKYGLNECLPHWSNGNSIMNNDYQARFSVGCAAPGRVRDGTDCTDTNVILAQTSGLQTGTIPYAVSEGTSSFNGTCSQRPDLGKADCDHWIAKTHLALALPHEVRPARLDNCQIDQNRSACMIPGSPDNYFQPTPAPAKVTQLLRQFGYDDPGCDIFRFWESDIETALQWTGPLLRPLLVNCRGAANASTSPHSIAVRDAALILFASFGPSGTVNFRLNHTTLGLRPGAVAADAVTNETFVASSGGNFSFWLNQHDYRFVIVK